MIKAAIDKILSLGGYKAEPFNNRLYSNGPTGILPIKPPQAETLNINTLTGIKDYGPTDGMMIHVLDHKTVHVVDKEFADSWLTRSTFLTAVHDSPVFRFGQRMNVEDFIISLQAMFVQDETTAKILSVVGNIKEEAVSQYSDDGVTQSVMAKAGISRVEITPVPNPVTLRPYRTFMEIEQPASTFVFRMQSGKGQSPSCALYEADGRMWSLTAIQSIKTWLSEKVPGVKIIA
ncbi:MAG: hypothetical protein WC450_10145 [Candidatus Omnitrophota bacterium]|jgi:hypothetical protein